MTTIQLTVTVTMADRDSIDPDKMTEVLYAALDTKYADRRIAYEITTQQHKPDVVLTPR